MPVPPPIPAATNTISAPSTTARSSSRDSIADLLPISGSEPAPRPFVSSLPSIMRQLASESSRWAMSVFAAMNSTPLTPPRIMWFSALLPAPPTPTTFMTSLAGKFDLSSWKISDMAPITFYSSIRSQKRSPKSFFTASTGLKPGASLSFCPIGMPSDSGA